MLHSVAVPSGDWNLYCSVPFSGSVALTVKVILSPTLTTTGVVTEAGQSPPPSVAQELVWTFPRLSVTVLIIAGSVYSAKIIAGASSNAKRAI